MFENSEYFETILTYGTLSKAASVLGISQPALTNYVKQLEAKAGATLFDRSTSPIILTEAGKIFYRYMKQTEAVKKNYLNEIADLEHKKSGSLTIGGASSTTACYLSRVTARFLQKYPDCSVKILDGVVSDIARQALNGEIDFFITPESQRNTEFEYISLLDERLFMCVPETMVCRLSEQDAQTAKELREKAIPIDDFTNGKLAGKMYMPVDPGIFKDSRFILLEDGTNVREISNKLFAAWGYSPVNPVVVSQMLTGFHLSVSNAGISFLPESILKYGRFKDYPVIYALDESISHRRMYACCKKSKYMSVLCSEFIEMLKQTLMQ